MYRMNNVQFLMSIFTNIDKYDSKVILVGIVFIQGIFQTRFLSIQIHPKGFIDSTIDLQYSTGWAGS